MASPSPPSTRSGSEQLDHQAHATAPGHNPKPVKQRARRGHAIAVACRPCQKRKIKCDGGRPICDSCRSKSIHNCLYDYEPGMSRNAGYKLKIHELEKEVIRLKNVARDLSDRLGRHRENCVINHQHIRPPPPPPPTLVDGQTPMTMSESELEPRTPLFANPVHPPHTPHAVVDGQYGMVLHPGQSISGAEASQYFSADLSQIPYQYYLDGASWVVPGAGGCVIPQSEMQLGASWWIK